MIGFYPERSIAESKGMAKVENSSLAPLGILGGKG